jgi:para-nitrobenzyl esterase
MPGPLVHPGSKASISNHLARPWHTGGLASLRPIHWIIPLLALSVVLCIAPSYAQPASPPVVTIDSGTLAGAQFGAPNEVMFLGIPFAAPPTGDRRWRPPQPVQPWKGTRNASVFGPACPQAPDDIENLKSYAAETPGAAPHLNFQTSEDCLSLNVWTAAWGKPGKLPVMVWIHGGGNIFGTGQYPPFGQSLSRKGVVFVSLQYRLGALGFLAHPALTAESPHHASGNYAILDQIAALQWVRRNVAQFGGDPHNVTVFGESAGGVMVCYLMASPQAHGLFERAILESCTCRDYVSPELKTLRYYEGGSGTSEQIGLRLERDLGIAPGAGALARLRAAPADQILRAASRDPGLNFYAGGTVDGWVLPEQPAVIFAAGRQAHVPVITGSNADEGSVFRALLHPPALQNYRAWLKSHFLEQADDVFRAYPAASDATAPAAFQALHDDYLRGATVHALVRDMARAGSPAYLYYFTYTGKGTYADLGSFHGLDLAFVGGGFFRPSRWGAPDAADLNLAAVMSAYWTQFAATGDPNRAGLPPWPRFDPRTDLCLELGTNVHLRPVPHAARFALFYRSLKARLAATPKPE